MKKYKPKIGDKVRVVMCSMGVPIHEGRGGIVEGFENGGLRTTVVGYDGVYCSAIKVEPYIEKRGRPKGSQNKIVVHGGIYYSRNGKMSGQEPDCPKGGIHDWRYAFEKGGLGSARSIFYCTKCLEFKEKKV